MTHLTPNLALQVSSHTILKARTSWRSTHSLHRKSRFHWYSELQMLELHTMCSNNFGSHWAGRFLTIFSYQAENTQERVEWRSIKTASCAQLDLEKGRYSINRLIHLKYLLSLVWFSTRMTCLYHLTLNARTSLAYLGSNHTQRAFSSSVYSWIPVLSLDFHSHSRH